MEPIEPGSTKSEYYYNDWIRATCVVFLACVFGFFAWQFWLFLPTLWMYTVAIAKLIAVGIGALIVLWVAFKMFAGIASVEVPEQKGYYDHNTGRWHG
jgi:protein-S-isoprenylcysteine O-methyltransferase Ste14